LSLQSASSSLGSVKFAQPEETAIMQVPLCMFASCHKHTVARHESKLLLQLLQEYYLESGSIIVTILKGL